MDVAIPPSSFVNRLIRRLLDPVIARVEDVETAVGANIIYAGRQNMPEVGTSDLSNRTYVLENTNTVSGVVVGIDVWGANGGGTITIGRWKSVGGYHDIVPDTAPVTITIPGDGLQHLVGPGDFAPFAVVAGERFGIYPYSGGSAKMRTTSGAESDGNSFFIQPGEAGYVTSFIDSGASPGARMEIRFHIQQSSLSDIQDNLAALDATVAALETKSLTLVNGDKIVFFGDSITEALGTLPGKSWPAKVLAGTDWNGETFSESGRTVEQIITRIVAGATLSGSGLTLADYQGTHAIICLATNDDDDGGTIPQFQEAMGRLVMTLRGMGYVRIALLCPHGRLFDSGDMRLSAAIKAMATELGCDFIDIPRHLVRMLDFDTRYGPFTDGVSHLGVRTNDLWRAPVEAYVRSLGQPRTGLKIFRKRSGVTVTVPEDLNYADLFDRERLFRELQVGEYALSGSGLNFYDELDSASATGGVSDSEYCKIIAGTATTITAGDWGLIEAALPYTAQHLTSVSLALSGATGVTVYVRDVIVSSDPGEVVGAFVEIEVADGVYTIPQATLYAAMDGAKLPIWVTKSGDFSITGLEVGYKPNPAAVLKPNLPPAPVPIPLGAELLAEPLVGTSEIASWTVTGTVTPTDAFPGGDLPPVTAATEAAPVDDSNYIAQAVTWSADNFDTQAMVVAVTAGLFPALFDSGDTYPDDAPITSDTFDWARLVVELIYTGPDPDFVLPLTAKVGLWWDELRWETIAPATTTGCTVRIRAADATVIYVAKASVKMVAA